jgi:AbrB family looped-hinge helix DNA binding protein
MAKEVQHVEIMEIVMIGDSTVYARIPADVAAALGIKKGTKIRLTVFQDETIEIRKE